MNETTVCDTRVLSLISRIYFSAKKQQKTRKSSNFQLSKISKDTKIEKMFKCYFSIILHPTDFKKLQDLSIRDNYHCAIGYVTPSDHCAMVVKLFDQVFCLFCLPFVWVDFNTCLLLVDDHNSFFCALLFS